MRHNKKRNTALLYEFLIRHISKCLIESRKDEANRAVELVKKYYKSGPLKEELELFNQALLSQFKTPEYASKILSSVMHRSKKINGKRLDEKKTKLIKEINKTFDAASFFGHKIPNYVMYASLQTLLNDQNGHKPIIDSVKRYQLEEKLVAHLVEDKKQSTLEQTLKLDPQYNNAVYRLVINKFNEKYAKTLSEAQKKILSKYAVALITENASVLIKSVQSEIENVRVRLASNIDSEVRKDKDLMIKLSECRNRLDGLAAKKINESVIVSVLQFMALADEVGQ